MSLPPKTNTTDSADSKPKPCKDVFWAIWLFLFVSLCAFILFFSAGCEAPSAPQIKVVTKEEKDVMVAEELALPPNAKNIVKINDEWHTFDLTIDGRTRKFLRRTYAVFKHGNGQAQYSTEAFTELTPQ